MKTILITGGSGLVGKELTKMLMHKGYRVIWLSREQNLQTIVPQYFWDYTKGEIDMEALHQADIIIHLSGESIGSGRWTADKKEKIIQSRVETASLLLSSLKKLNKKPEAFISASAVGVYGKDTTQHIYTEEDEPVAGDFLARVCREWEEAVRRFTDELDCRTVIIRTGMILSANSPAFKKMYTSVKFGLGAPFGNGNQYWSWVHIRDLCEMYIKAVEDETMKGAYNAVAPQYITNREFMQTFAGVMARPILLPSIPAFLLRIVMGKSADMVLGGSSISSQKILDEKFLFHYTEAEQALINCINE